MTKLEILEIIQSDLDCLSGDDRLTIYDFIDYHNMISNPELVKYRETFLVTLAKIQENLIHYYQSILPLKERGLLSQFLSATDVLQRFISNCIKEVMLADQWYEGFDVFRATIFLDVTNRELPLIITDPDRFVENVNYGIKFVYIKSN